MIDEMNNVARPKIEFFCGTGGVGKSTLSAARAVYMAKSKKTLLITVDPSRRLKDLLHLTEVGVLKHIDHFENSFDAFIMNPSQILTELISKKLSTQELPTRILQHLGNPFGGLHDLLSLVKLAQFYEEKNYELIIVDTAPGKHFLDFLNGIETINKFFNHQWLQKIPNLFEAPKSFFGQFFQVALDRLLLELYKVTGQSFVQEFIQTLKQVSELKSSFLKVQGLIQGLKDRANTHFFITLQSEQHKTKDIFSFRESLSLYHPDQFSYLYNRSLSKLLKKDLLEANFDSALKRYTTELIDQEEKTILLLKENCPRVLQFEKELLPLDILLHLTNQWSHYATDFAQS